MRGTENKTIKHKTHNISEVKERAVGRSAISGKGTEQGLTH